MSLEKLKARLKINKTDLDTIVKAELESGKKIPELEHADYHLRCTIQWLECLEKDDVDPEGLSDA